MSEKVTERQAITILRLYGPASCAVLAKAGGVNRESLYRAMHRLSRSGEVICKPRRYLLSVKGYRAFEAMYSRPLLTAVESPQ